MTYPKFHRINLRKLKKNLSEKTMKKNHEEIKIKFVETDFCHPLSSLKLTRGDRAANEFRIC